MGVEDHRGASKALRNDRLDGLRGIAALSVALGHCLLAVGGVELWARRIGDFGQMEAGQIFTRLLSILFPADAAVMVFFVLSGHVLWKSFARKNSSLRDLPDYLLARAYRLLPLVIVTTIPFAFLSNVSAADLTLNMLLLSSNVNTVLWSLQAEIAGSLAIFAIWIWARDRIWKTVAYFFVSCAIVPFFRGNVYVVFIPAFVLGALIGAVPDRIWRSGAILLSGALVLLLANLVLGHGGLTRCFEMVAAMVVVGCVGAGRLPFLASRPVLFLGTISYPFYLLHPVSLSLSVSILSALLPGTWGMLTAVPLYALVSIAFTIVFAWVLHVLVEQPAMRTRPRVIASLPLGAASVAP